MEAYHRSNKSDRLTAIKELLPEEISWPTLKMALAICKTYPTFNPRENLESKNNQDEKRTNNNTNINTNTNTNTNTNSNTNTNTNLNTPSTSTDALPLSDLIDQSILDFDFELATQPQPSTQTKNEIQPTKRSLSNALLFGSKPPQPSKSYANNNNISQNSQSTTATIGKRKLDEVGNINCNSNSNSSGDNSDTRVMKKVSSYGTNFGRKPPNQLIFQFDDSDLNNNNSPSPSPNGSNPGQGSTP